jgi:hypothetical protein
MQIFRNPFTSMDEHMYLTCRPLCRAALHLLFSLWMLRTGQSWDRTPVETIFSAPIRSGPGPRPTFYTMRTGSLPGVKRPGRGVDHPTPSSGWVKWRCELNASTPCFHGTLQGAIFLFVLFFCLCECIIYFAFLFFTFTYFRTIY